jgi:hypothetical protein
LGFRTALINSRRANARIDSRGLLIKDLDREFPYSVGIDDGFVLVERLDRESVIGNRLLSFTFFVQNPGGSEVTSSLSITHFAIFSFGYSALFPATPRGTYDRNRTANRTLIFIFNSPYPKIGSLQIFLVRRTRRFSFLPNPR